MDSISLEETNKIRVAAGLAPLADPSANSEPVLNDEEIAVQNWKDLRHAEESAKSTLDLKERLEKARSQRELAQKLSGKSLGQEGDDDALAWVRKSKKQAKKVAQDLARKKQAELEAMDAELAAQYGEDELAGLRVGHDMEAFDEGKEHVLTLKDSRILDGEDDELVNIDMAEQSRLESRLDLKKKGKDAGKYKAYEDEEDFNAAQSGKAKGVLSKYDIDIDDQNTSVSLGFTLAKRRAKTEDVDQKAAIFQAVERPVDKSTQAKQDLAKELNKTLVELTNEKTFASDYLQEGEAGFKKSKSKKKKAKGNSTRKREDDAEDDGDMPMPSKTSQADLDRAALVDDEELQAALARQRRAKNRRQIEALKRVAAEQAASPFSRDMSVEPSNGVDTPIKAEPTDDDDEAEGGLVLNDTTEFVRNITLEGLQSRPKPAAKQPKQRSESAQPDLDALPLTEVDTSTFAKVEDEAEDGEMMDVDNEAQAAALLADDEPAPQQADGLEGTSAELHINRGLTSTISLLRNQGLMSALTDEERQADQKYRDRQTWLAKRRQEQADFDDARAVSKAAGSSKDQKTREVENKQRERDSAKRDLDAFKNYKPEINIRYMDEFGREMNMKEAWKDLSHKFHGKGSGTHKIEKRLKKIEDERKRTAMASGDTPLSVNAAFQARQEKLGTATMILSAGNKLTAPNADDFQTSGVVDPSKKSKGKGKNAKPEPAAEINLTPSLDAPVTSVNGVETAPVPRRAGFKPINKRVAEDIVDSESKRQRII